jgi:hypothetical protein
VIFGEVTNFKREIRIQNEIGGDFEDVQIDLMFTINGNTFFGFPFTNGDEIPLPVADAFVENEFVNPNHNYMMVVPAGEIELTTYVTVDGAVDPRFTPTVRQVTVGPGGARELNLNISLSPAPEGPGTF